MRDQGFNRQRRLQLPNGEERAFCTEELAIVYAHICCKSPQKSLALRKILFYYIIIFIKFILAFIIKYN